MSSSTRSKASPLASNGERPNDVILAVTRAQGAALREIKKRGTWSWGEGPSTRVLQSLTEKGLAESHWTRQQRDRYTLTGAGKALVRCLIKLHGARSRAG